MTDRLIELRERIEAVTCTADEVREYCWLAFEPRPGMFLQPYNEFVLDDSVDAFRWIKNWWKLPEYPRNLPEPNLLAFLWAIYTPTQDIRITLNDKLMEFYYKGRQYCELNGMNPDQPYEDPEETRRRRNRERMKEVRGHRKIPDKDITDDSLRAQVRELEAQIEAVKATAAAIDEMHRKEVIEHQTAMIQASAARKEAAQEHKISIDALRNEIKNLTAKQ